MKFIFRSDTSITRNRLLKPKWNSLQEVITKMMNPVFRLRPNCTELLSQFDSWDITIAEVKSSENYSKNLDQLENFCYKFFISYLINKFVYID